MKSIIIIGSKNFGSKNNPLDIYSSIKLENKKLIYWEDLLFEISNTSQKIVDTISGLDIAESKLVILFGWYKKEYNGIYKDMALTLAKYLQAHSIEFWNEEALVQRSTTKLSAMMQLAMAGIDIPNTRFSLKTDVMKSLISSFPYILKATAASRGRDNYLISDANKQSEILTNSINVFLNQEYISNNYDLRLVCFEGEPQLAIKRSRTNHETHLNNTSQGAKAELIDLRGIPIEILTKTKKICKIMKRQMAGVDWLVANDGSGRYACLEVNAIPQLTSGSFINEKLNTLNNILSRKD